MNHLANEAEPGSAGTLLIGTGGRFDLDGHGQSGMVDKEAILWRPAGDGRIVCYACNRRCSIPEGSHGFCYVRKNVGGKLYLSSYGKLAAMQIDPIEKKPFNH